MNINDKLATPSLNDQGAIPKEAFIFKKETVAYIDPKTGKRTTVEIDKPSLREDTIKKDESLDYSTPKRTGVLGPLHPDTIVTVSLTERCPLEVYPIGDLCLLKNIEYVLKNNDDPITEVTTGIPDSAPIPGNWSGKYAAPSALANKKKYKTQGQLLKYILDHPARYNLSFINIKYEQTPEVEARLNTEKAKNIKEQILAEKKAAEKRVAELEKALSTAQKNEETAKKRIEE